MNTGDKVCESENGLLSTIGIQLGGHTQYALEGSVFVGGAVIQWLRDEMRFFSESRDAEYYAGKVKDTGRRLFRSGLHRTGRATLGYVRPRLHDRPDARHDARAYHPRRAGVDRLSGQRSADGHEARHQAYRSLPFRSMAARAATAS